MAIAPTPRRGNAVLTTVESVLRPDVIRDVVSEALANVAKHSQATRVAVRVLRDRSTLRVEVEDNGVGIPEQYSGRIFEPFFSTKATGTGVGLSICQVILKAHGGSLQVNANVPFGTVMRVVLPAGVDE